jgi:hypothetical protein
MHSPIHTAFFSSSVPFSLFTAVPKYLKFATFSNDSLANDVVFLGFGDTYFLHLQFSPEDGYSMIIRNVGTYLQVYTQPKSTTSSSSTPLP